MTQKSIKYFPEVDTLEHEDATPPETKRVLLYGWDADSLQKVRIKTNESGAIESGGGQYKTIIDETTTDIVYIGKAPLGTATSSAVWEIMKKDDTGTTTIFTWGSGKWDDRATTVTYS